MEFTLYKTELQKNPESLVVTHLNFFLQKNSVFIWMRVSSLHFDSPSIEYVLSLPAMCPQNLEPAMCPKLPAMCPQNLEPTGHVSPKP